MKKSPFLVILFIFSLYFLIPVAKPSVSITAIPDTPTSETFRFQSTGLLFQSEINDLVIVNITYLNLSTNTTEPVHVNEQFVGEIRLSLPQPGFFQVTVLSSSLGLIDIKEVGIHPIGLGVFFTFLFLNIALAYQRIQEYML